MIQQTEIKFYAGPRLGDRLDIYLVKIELGKTYNGYLKEGNIIWNEIDEGANWDAHIPFMRIPHRFPIQELIDALTDKEVLPTTKQAEIDSELKATKYHLEDLRKLVFKDK